MMLIPFVWNGTEDGFRALAPGPAVYWGKWTATVIGSALVGVIATVNPNVRDHTHPQMTLLPASGHRALSDSHLSALSALNIGIGKGDTLTDALVKIHGATGADFLHPDRF